MDGHGDLEPVSRETTSSIIAAQLRTRIISGFFPPGAQMAEAQLAKQLQVSRGPLREAMQRLVQEGLLRSERHRGLFVISLTTADVADIYLARGAVERAAVIRILEQGLGHSLDPLEKVVEQMEAAARRSRSAGVADLDVRFHDELVAMSRSERLQRMNRTLLVETRICLNQLQPRYSDVKELVSEHRELLQALRSGNQAQVLRLVESHMQDAVERLSAEPPREPSAAGPR